MVASYWHLLTEFNMQDPLAVVTRKPQCCEVLNGVCAQWFIIYNKSLYMHTERNYTDVQKMVKVTASHLRTIFYVT